MVSARGDLSLTYWQNNTGKHFEGAAWVAGGLGFCESESWIAWEKRWWGNSWCWTAGAYIKLNYESNKGDGWSLSWDADYEQDVYIEDRREASARDCKMRFCWRSEVGREAKRGMLMVIE